MAVPLTAIAFLVPMPGMFFALALPAEIGLFLSTSPVNAIGLRAVPPELRASAMAAMIFAIHLFGDLWSPLLIGAFYVPPKLGAMMLVPIAIAISAIVWWAGTGRVDRRAAPT